jgi:hypothetical protein
MRTGLTERPSDTTSFSQPRRQPALRGSLPATVSSAPRIDAGSTLRSKRTCYISSAPAAAKGSIGWLNSIASFANPSRFFHWSLYSSLRPLKTAPAPHGKTSRSPPRASALARSHAFRAPCLLESGIRATAAPCTATGPPDHGRRSDVIPQLSHHERHIDQPQRV